jgi:monoamine oxidase
MSATKAEPLDVAIVGGGISGLYSGWRLLTGGHGKGGGSKPRVEVFESSARTGGRLLTWHPVPGSSPALNAELGGMRFFRQQELVWGLVTNYFVKKNKLQPPIKFFVGDPNNNNLWYLRERILKAGDLTDPRRLPYRLDARGRYGDPGGILNGIIDRVLTENRDVVLKALGGRTTPQNWHDWDLIKPKLRYGRRPLWDSGFWNLLWDQFSPETYNYVTDAFGYYSLTNNWNAAEAMQSVFTDFTQNPDYQTLHEGYDHLPALLREEFEEAGGVVHLNTPVASIDGGKGGLYKLTFNGDKKTEVLAKRVILAMPRRSLELLQETKLWRLKDKIGGTTKSKTLQDYIRSVIPYPAFKMFLVYNTRWWQKPPVSIAAGRSVCDMPIRQTYYFPPVPDPFAPDKPPADGPGLVMATYDDANAVPFWQTLEGTQEQKDDSDAVMEKLFRSSSRKQNAASGKLQQYREETHRALIDDKGFYFAPPEMVRHAREQLTLLHFNQPLPSPVTVP